MHTTDLSLGHATLFKSRPQVSYILAQIVASTSRFLPPLPPPIYLTDHLFELLFLALVSNRIIYHCDPPAVIIPSRIVSSCTPAYFLLRLLLLSV